MPPPQPLPVHFERQGWENFILYIKEKKGRGPRTTGQCN